jgi:hypothetical protein
VVVALRFRAWALPFFAITGLLHED